MTHAHTDTSATPTVTRRLAALAVAAGLLAGACSSSTAAPRSTASAGTTSAGAGTGASTTAVVSAGGPSTARPPSTTASGTASGAATTSPAAVIVVPESFYTPPSPLPDGAPGDLIRSTPLTAPPGSKGYAILYRSTTVDGSPTAVSGVVYVPDNTPTKPRDVLSWAHGTTGLGDQCASSRAYADQTAVELAIVTFVTQQNLVFVATDYQGLGTPGPHPYLVNQSEGRNVLDAIRAAERLAATGATDASRAVVWGHSQGGGAAAFAAELQPTYAPELKVVGAVAGAPAADFGTLAASATAGGDDFGFALMAVTGFAAAYPDVSLDKLLTDKGRALAASIQTECSDKILNDLKATPPSELLQPAVATDPALAARLKENSAGYLKTAVPIWLYHGDADTTVPPAASKNMLDRYCAEGVNAARKVYPGTDHTSVVLAAAFDILGWIQDRLAGKPAVSSC